MKEELVAAALRLQVAIKISQDDELTIMSLRREAAAARMNEVSCKKQTSEAVEIIQNLKIEISSLKRKLKESTAQRLEASNLSSSSEWNEGNVFAQADAEVDVMFATAPKIKFHRDHGGDPNKATPFQQWKMEKFIHTADTPAGSLNHDKHTVDMLAEAATKASLYEFSHSRPIRSSIAKMRKSTNSDILTKSATLPSLEDVALRKGEKGAFNIWTSTNASPTKSPRRPESVEKGKHHVPLFV